MQNLELKRKSQEQFFELKRKVNSAIQQVGLDGQKAQVALALDISASMMDLFHRGVVQRVVERALALSVKFDDNGAVDVFLFGAKDYAVGELKEEDFFGYVDGTIRTSYPLEAATRYAGVIKRITDYYLSANSSDPAYVLFITDGDNADHKETERELIAASSKAIFWQFVGVGNSNFRFLQRLDDLPGRVIDNANFFQISDIEKIDDAELYGKLLSEFPSWLTLAKQHGIIGNAS